jgi:hypothetical protein
VRRAIVPIPTYFITGPDEEKLMPGSREQICENLFYLGVIEMFVKRDAQLLVFRSFWNCKTERIEHCVHFWQIWQLESEILVLQSCILNNDVHAQNEASNFLRGDIESLVSTWAVDEFVERAVSVDRR